MASTSDSILDYKKHVERMFLDGSQIMFTNRDRDHAAVLISTLFNKAEREVVVLCRNLDSEFYSRDVVKEAIHNAIKRGVHMRIRVQEPPQSGELAALLQDPQYKNIDYAVFEPGSRGATSEFNFTVADSKAFRLEEDRTKHAAVACANNPELAKQILTVFESLG